MANRAAYEDNLKSVSALALEALSLLKDIRVRHAKEDVTELLTTAQMLQVIVTKLQGHACKTDGKEVAELLKCTTSFCSLLRTVVSEEKLKNSARKKIDQASSQVNRALEGALQASGARISRPDDHAGSSPAAAVAEEMEEKGYDETSAEQEEFVSVRGMDSFVNSTQESRNKMVASTLRCMIADPAGKKLWFKQFGANQFMVPWEDFHQVFVAFAPAFELLDEAHVLRLQQVLDKSNTGFVSMYKFGEFLKGFGGLDNCCARIQEMFDAPWFFGFISHVETEYLLENQGPGTFLIRFSKSNPGSFALGFRMNNAKQPIMHILIKTVGVGVFAVQARNGEVRFNRISEVVDHYAKLLQQPLDTLLPVKEWYNFGELSEAESELFLTEAPNNAFLLRFDTEQHSYVLSYRHDDRAYHSIMEVTESTIMFKGDEQHYGSWMELLTTYEEVLQIPVTAVYEQD